MAQIKKQFNTEKGLETLWSALILNLQSCSHAQQYAKEDSITGTELVNFHQGCPSVFPPAHLKALGVLCQD